MTASFRSPLCLIPELFLICFSLALAACTGEVMDTGEAEALAESEAAVLNYSYTDQTFKVFASMDLTGANFTGANVSDSLFLAVTAPHIVFYGATGFKANFNAIDSTISHLEDADFYGATFNYSLFKKARLDRARFYGATLYRGKFYDAHLEDAVLYGANFSEANLHGAQLDRVDCRGADLGEVTVVYNEVVKGADFRSANCEKADFGSADLRKTNFTGANLKGAKLAYADLRGATLKNANASGANLCGMRIDIYTDLTGFIQTGADCLIK